MKTSIIVFKKELIDALRDRRTLTTMVLLPLLLFPVLIGISSKMMMKQVKTAREKTLKIGLITHGNAQRFRQMLLEESSVDPIEGLTVGDGRSLIEGDSLNTLIVFDPRFDEQVASLGQGKVTLYFKSAEKRDIEQRRVRSLLDDFAARLRTDRFEAMGLDTDMIETVDMSEQNLASSKERLAELVGGFLPYLFIIFCFTGSMYAAIDLAAGEKERGTLETLFTSPAGRFSILLGKFGVVVLTGLLSASMSIVGLYVGIRLNPDIPGELLQTVLGILEFQSIVMLLLLLLPLTMFFAALLLSVSIFAKSFKEAQSFVQPFLIAVIVPAFLGMMPGITLNPKTALVPIVNVSLATKEIIAGTITPGLLAEAYASLIFFAIIGLVVCARVFERESTIFRGI
ncbi:MAG: ABC transporter permease subunit [Candidatus Krumholzibacteria bacterium]|nr:ABC transporter permease subunit [Candidatus Krumholzibacteria bacterium]